MNLRVFIEMMPKGRAVQLTVWFTMLGTSARLGRRGQKRGFAARRAARRQRPVRA